MDAHKAQMLGSVIHLPKLLLESVLLKGSSAYYKDNTEINQSVRQSVRPSVLRSVNQLTEINLKRYY